MKDEQLISDTDPVLQLAKRIMGLNDTVEQKRNSSSRVAKQSMTRCRHTKGLV